ncbi:MAG: methionyl-tRNA formyltransferase, partial [Bacteroidota bacterium]
MTNLRIVFLGTPDFAVASLRKLIEHGCQIVGVITAPDRMGGRGRKQVIESPVKKYAQQEGLQILQPKNLKAPSFVEELRSLQADLQIVVAFRMLPVVVWDMPRLGTYNLHGSLLPAYRGAAPINWAVMNGEEQTGVTTFKLKHEIDTGSMAFQRSVPIHKIDNVGDVHDRMMVVGAELIVETVQAIANETIQLREQEESQVSKAPKIYSADCEIDMTIDIQRIYHHIRGLSPYPGAWMQLFGSKTKIFKCTYSYQHHGHPIGQ